MATSPVKGCIVIPFDGAAPGDVRAVVYGRSAGSVAGAASGDGRHAGVTTRVKKRKPKTDNHVRRYGMFLSRHFMRMRSLSVGMKPFIRDRGSRYVSTCINGTVHDR